MSIVNTIAELTGDLFSELKFSATASLITGSFMPVVCDLLVKAGYNVISGEYDLSIENAVADFQSKVGLAINGILDSATLQALNNYNASLIKDEVTEEETDSETLTDEQQETDSPHYNSFFDEDNYKTNRKNHKDIIIEFGNESITKTIKDVFMRSVSVEVDTSGNPIFEVYEFIGRDVKESDEYNDTDKYTLDNELSSSSDIKYNFNFGKTE